LVFDSQETSSFSLFVENQTGGVHVSGALVFCDGANALVSSGNKL
jgi:hypothetical protein